MESGTCDRLAWQRRKLSRIMNDLKKKKWKAARSLVKEEEVACTYHKGSVAHAFVSPTLD